MRSLGILGNNIGEEQANNLIQILDGSDTLTTLCGFTGTETELDLSGRSLSASCAILVANEVKFNSVMIKLDISNNKLTQGNPIPKKSRWDAQTYETDMSGVISLSEAIKQSA